MADRDDLKSLPRQAANVSAYSFVAMATPFTSKCPDDLLGSRHASAGSGKA